LTAPLFEHIAEVGVELRAAPHLLLGLDFDGTLAPIVPRPEDAWMPEDTRSTLEALASRPDITIAVVSGRAMPDLVSRVGLNVILAANHGLEIFGGGLNFRYQPAENGQNTLHRICRAISRKSAKIPGVLIEDKGLTASVHFRGLGEPGRNELLLIVRTAVEPVQDRFEARRGKEVLEIVPRVSWNKGSAVLWILDQVQRKMKTSSVSVCYIGDDATDEDVFRSIDGVTICVDGHGPTSARFGVRDAVEAANFLRWLLSTPFTARHLNQAEDSPPGSTQPSANR
jgi:trehalose 6-phosphate phosphatase